MGPRAKEPKTWASTQLANAGAPPGARGRPRMFNKSDWSARRSHKRDRDVELQKLETGLVTYSHKSPVGPNVASGCQFIEPSYTKHPEEVRTALAKPGQRLAAPSLAYTTNADEADDLCACLGPGPLGLDLEWNFSRVTGRSERTALLQICSSSLILILHISAMRKLPPALLKVLHDPDVIKTGVAIRNDVLKLQRDFGINTRNVVELSAVAKLAQPAKWATTHSLISLRNLTRIYLGQRLDKSDVRVSNWQTVPLSAEQIEYAANDTFASLEILRELCSYFPPTGSEVVPLLEQLDGILLDKPQSRTIDLSTALRMSSHDLYQERKDLQHVERQRQEMAKVLRQIRPNAEETSSITVAVPISERVSSTQNVHQDDDSDDITVTKVMLAHTRATHTWLYGNQTIDQIAVASRIKLSTAASYLIKALDEAHRDGTSGLLDDFSTQDKARLDSELDKAGEVLVYSLKRYRDLATRIGWDLPKPNDDDSGLSSDSKPSQTSPASTPSLDLDSRDTIL